MKTILYAGISNPEISGIGIDKFIDAAHILSYELVPFDGYTRFGHDQKQRDENLSGLMEILNIVRHRTGNKTVRIWDVADEETIRRADAEWSARMAGK